MAGFWMWPKQAPRAQIAMKCLQLRTPYPRHSPHRFIKEVGFSLLWLHISKKHSSVSFPWQTSQSRPIGSLIFKVCNFSVACASSVALSGTASTTLTCLGNKQCSQYRCVVIQWSPSLSQAPHPVMILTGLSSKTGVTSHVIDWLSKPNEARGAPLLQTSNWIMNSLSNVSCKYNCSFVQVSPPFAVRERPSIFSYLHHLAVIYTDGGLVYSFDRWEG